MRKPVAASFYTHVMVVLRKGDRKTGQRQVRVRMTLNEYRAAINAQ